MPNRNPLQQLKEALDAYESAVKAQQERRVLLSLEEECKSCLDDIDIEKLSDRQLRELKEAQQAYAGHLRAHLDLQADRESCNEIYA